MSILAFILVLLGAAVYFGIKSYNAVQVLVQRVRKSASNAQVAVSKKLSLVNQMIDLVKNYQEGEQFVQLKIAQDANAAALASTYQQSGSMMAAVQGVADRFPNLKASEQYTHLSHSIAMCEHDVQVSRQHYNDAIEAYNNARLRIPTLFIARFMGFSEAPYLKFDLSGVQDVTSLKEFKTDDGERLQQLLHGAGKGIAGAAKSLADNASHAGRLLSDKILHAQVRPQAAADDGERSEENADTSTADKSST